MPNNFEKALEKKKTTTYRVSQETGIPNTTLFDWKTGKYVPNAMVVKKVAEYLKMPMEKLL